MVSLVEKIEARGKAKGKAEGNAEGKCSILWKLILKKFPSVEKYYYEKIKQIPVDKLDDFALELLDINDYRELDKFIMQN